MAELVSDIIQRIDRLEKLVGKNTTRESRGWEINKSFAAAAATYTVTLPQFGRNLRILGSVRSDKAAVTTDFLQMRVNADAGANYNFEQIQAIAAVVGSAETLAANQWTIAEVSAVNATALYWGYFDMVLYNYWTYNTNLTKVGFTCTNYHARTNAASGRRLDIWGGDYMGNAPITSLTFFTGGNIVINSMITIYATN